MDNLDTLIALIGLALYLLVPIVWTILIVMIVKKITRKRKQEAAKREEYDRRAAEYNKRKAAEEAIRKKLEAERKAEEEKRKQEEEKRLMQDVEKRLLGQYNGKIPYLQNQHLQKWAKEFAHEFIKTISGKICGDIHYDKIIISCRRSGRKDEILGFNFYKENIKPFESDDQLQLFMDTLLAFAEEIVKLEYVVKHPFNTNGNRYYIKHGSYWDGPGYYRNYVIYLEYSAPNPDYQAPRNFV